MSFKYTGSLFFSHKLYFLSIYLPLSTPSLCLVLSIPGSFFGQCTTEHQPLHAQQKKTYTFSPLLPIHFDRLFTHFHLCSMNNKKICWGSFKWWSKILFLIFPQIQIYMSNNMRLNHVQYVFLSHLVQIVSIQCTVWTIVGW